MGLRFYSKKYISLYTFINNNSNCISKIFNILKKFNMFRQFYPQASIFIIKVFFLPNADILDFGDDNIIKT